MPGRSAHFCAILATLLLSACGGGGGGHVQSTPTPAPVAAPPATPVSRPAGSDANFDTAEYRASSGPAFHGAITAYEMGASGAGVMVGIVDSGIANADGEFTGRISTLSRDFAGNGSYADVGGHGTAVAATLAGARNAQHVHGMAWGATVLALRTDAPGSCAGSGCEHSAGAMAQAIDYAWRSGARIINISLGGDFNSPDLLAAVSRATSAGSIIVVAAGNGRNGQASPTPNQLATSIANPVYGHGLVIVATSVNDDGGASAFSNGAQGVEGSTLSALGDAVRTIDHQGTDLLYTGTSFSAPQIAGTAALLAQAFPNLSSAQIVHLLLSTARDAGAPGADAVYGRGILDVAGAFRPQGTLSLAGSATALAPADTTLLSGAMGDAAPAGLGAVILDSYRRPFRADLAAGMERMGRRSRLIAALAGTSRQLRGQAGPLSLAFNVAPGRVAFEDRTAAGAEALAPRTTRFISGTISARLATTGTLALGLRTGLADLTQSLEAAPRPVFLMAGRGGGATADELRAETSLAWRQGLGAGLALINGIEAGSVDGRVTPRPGADMAALRDREARYQAILSALAWTRGAIGLTGGLRLVNEEGSTLGARFVPALGAQRARSLFAALEATARPIEGLTLTAGMQRGWTHAAAGGALDRGGTIRTRSWSLDIAQTGLFAPGDLMGLRVSAPLRVTTSRFDLNLPQSWDWKSETATMARTPLSLVPQGSERDYELSYGLGLSGGWLGANLFVRTQAGNVTAMPDDVGAALRWSARF